MESAYQKLAEPLLAVEMQTPKFAVISNVTGEEVKTLPDIRRTLQDQVTATVRWADCMKTLLERGCDFFIELGPGNVLAGLLQRISKGADVVSVGDAESVRECAERIRASA
jgi:[acyl-carrier-protein] S-malonyltransferase